MTVRPDRLAPLQRSVIDAVELLCAEEVALSDSIGRWLAEGVMARSSAPAFDCSAMDGYAVRAAEVTGPVHLKCERVVYAGELPGGPLTSGEAVRIFTGAPLPPGADAVVREEVVRPHEGSVEFRHAATPGENVREAGEDVKAGALALPPGTRLGARQLALLTAVGVERVSVVRRPRVAILATGDELVSRRTPNSNGVALSASLRALGAAVETEIVGDDLDGLSGSVARALERSDAVITIGGVSVGVRDLVPEAVARCGGEVRVHGVPMKPGKPFLFAIAAGKPIFGLPGSPSACLVAFEVFVRPALLRLSGSSHLSRRTLRLPLCEPIAGRADRTRFVWGRLEEEGSVRPMGRDTAQILGPALADVLLRLREGDAELAAGSLVESWLLEERG